MIRSAENRDLLLIDTDDQETATDFTILRNERMEAGAGYTSIKLAGPAVRTQTQRLADKYQDIIIDTGGRNTTSQRAAFTTSRCTVRWGRARVLFTSSTRIFLQPYQSSAEEMQLTRSS